VNTTPKRIFLINTAKAAKQAGHVWPDYAAAEAALESAWGQSELARMGNNLFGTKQSMHPRFGTMNLPTKEKLSDRWIEIEALWIVYPDTAKCFSDRMNLLRTMAKHYPHYAAALSASTGEGFIREVSRSWSTDPERAQKVLNIYSQHKAELQGAINE
jgi:flagellum-specific peptidoglycan hydrolase FlgJ